MTEAPEREVEHSEPTRSAGAYALLVGTLLVPIGTMAVAIAHRLQLATPAYTTSRLASDVVDAFVLCVLQLVVAGAVLVHAMSSRRPVRAAMALAVLAVTGICMLVALFVDAPTLLFRT